MNLVYTILGASFVTLIGIGAWRELHAAAVRRRQGRESPLTIRRTRRRLWGLVFLALSVALLANTPTLDLYVRNPMLRLAWIGMAFVCVLGAVWVAFRDLSETGKMAQDEAKRVVLESLANLQEEIAKARQERREESGENDRSVPRKRSPKGRSR